DAAGWVSHSLLSDHCTVLSVPAAVVSVPGRSARRGVAMGAVRVFERGGAGVLDAAAGDSAWPEVCAQQRQPVAVADVSVVAVRVSGVRGAGAGVSVLLVDASDRRDEPDLRAIFPRAVRARV